MAGKKRRAACKPAASTAARNNESLEDPDAASIAGTEAPVCATVLSNLVDIASSRHRSEALLQAFCDQKCWIDDSQTQIATAIAGGGTVSTSASPSRSETQQQQQSGPHLDCYWIVLSTNIMARLLAMKENQAKIAKEKHLIAYLATMADLTATILLSDKAKLEKACQNHPSRSILCRAILSATIASLYVIQKYDPNNNLPSQKGEIHPHHTLESAVASLDRFVFLRASIEDEGKKDGAELPPLTAVGSWDPHTLETDCTHVEQLLGSSCNLEKDCLQSLMISVSTEQRRTTASSDPPPPKRAARSRRGTNKPTPGSPSVSSTSESRFSETVMETVLLFAKLLATKDFGTRIDGRVAVKRWASVALIWSQNGEGQAEILKEIYRFALNVSSSKVMSHSQLSKIMYQMMGVASEAGTQGGSRPAAGGFEQYVRTISPSSSGKDSKAVSSQTKSQKICRKDIRDWATVAIYAVLQNHKECLQEVAQSHHSLDVVNDHDGDEAGLDLQHEVFLAPGLSSAISNLCSSAASSVSNSSYTDQAQWNRAMKVIACAHILDLLADSTLPLDCRLAKFALAQFADSVRRLDQRSVCNPSGSRVQGISYVDGTQDMSIKVLQDRLQKQYHLLESLPEPCVAPDRQSAAKKGGSAIASAVDCTFAGTFHPDSSFSADNFTDEQAVCVMIRGLHGRSSERSSSPTSMLFPFLIDVIRRTYDTRNERTHQIDGIDARLDNSTSRKRKRTTRKGASRSVIGKTLTGILTVAENQATWRRISSSRGLAALEAVGALEVCLTRPEGVRISLSGLIRTMPTTDNLYEILKLGTFLESIVLTHESDVSASQDLTYIEKQLWWAHMNVVRVLGKEQSSREAIVGVDSILWSSTKRSEVYCLVASQGTTNQCDANSKWPLSLSAAHHAFFAANMAFSRDGDMKSPEHLIVGGMIRSILEALRTFEDAVPENWPAKSSTNESTLLSYFDARTFMLAFNDLSIEEKRTHLECMVEGMMNLLQSVTSNESRRMFFTSNCGETTTFLGRVLVLCYSMVSSVLAGRELQAIFKVQMASFSPEVPRRAGNIRWHRRESTYLGLFGSWDSSALPECVTERNASIVPKTALDDLKSVFEKAFSLSFDCAPSDFCYLMFVTWNGLHQLPKDGMEEEQNCSFTSSTWDNPMKILQLRNDVCRTHNTLRTMSAQRLKMTLKHMIMQAHASVESILAEFSLEDSEMGQSIPAPAMVLLAALPLYVSFAVACFTERGNDPFSTNLSQSAGVRGQRERTYSSESEALNSDVDSDLEECGLKVRESTLSRLRQTCDALGAAPMHPDWLDVSCRLRDGLDFVELSDMTELALKTLSRLAAVSCRQLEKHQSLAISEAMDNDSSTDKYNLVVSLIHGYGSLLPCSMEVLEDIYSITECPVKVLEELQDTSSESKVHQIRNKFCPVSGQGLIGDLQEGHRLQNNLYSMSSAELRAGGEWELLLSTALTIACLDLRGQKEGGNDTLGQRSRFGVEKAKFWRHICSASIESMVPVAAFARMMVGKAGRSPHPFSMHDNKEDPCDAMPLHFNERIPKANSVSSTLKTTVDQTLTLLGCICFGGDNSLKGTCQAIASNLLRDTDSFLDLQSLHAVRYAFVSIRHAMKVAETTKSKTKKKIGSICSIIERLLAIVDEHGHQRVSGDGACDESGEDLKVLHTFLGVSRLPCLETVTESSISATDLLRRGQTGVFEEADQLYAWSNSDRQDPAIRDLVFLICSDSLCNNHARSIIAKLLSNIGSVEASASADDCQSANGRLVVLPATIKTFNDVEEKLLKTVVQKHLISNGITMNLSQLLSLLLFSNRDYPTFEKSRFMHDALYKLLDSWKKVPADAKFHIIHAFIAYGIRFQTLVQFGTRLIEVTSKSGEIDILLNFFTSLRQVKSTLTKDSQPGSMECGEDIKVCQVGNVPLDSFTLTRSCSFAQNSGFQEQHWYQCNTCGLVGDRGVCTLCALVCHKDHDVEPAASIKSSFYCDCNENDSSSEQSPCKCLSPLSSEQINKLVEQESIRCTRTTKRPFTHHRKQSSLLTRCLTPAETEKSISFQGMEPIAVEAMFRILESEFNKWSDRCTDLAELFLDHKRKNPVPLQIKRTPHTKLQKELQERNGSVLELKQLKEASLVPVYTATGFETKLSGDSACNAATMARLTRNHLSRQILTADSRGRLLIVEASKLVFLCPSVTDVRHIQQRTDPCIQRNSMPITGTVAMSHDVVGMELGCNDNLLVMWGDTQASVVLLKQTFDGVEETFRLAFDLDSDDHILNAKWLPGSDSTLVVSCSRFVRLYDINRFDSKFKSSVANEKRVNPVIGYNLGFEASLRGVALLSSKRYGNLEERISTKIFLLLANGQMHQLTIETSFGRIESPSDLQFEPSECVSIPTAGMRNRPLSSPNPPGSSSRTLGDDPNVAYLRQSRMLLYECTSTAVLAVMLDQEGDVQGSFEFLPHTIPSNVLGNGSSISGPYTHWTELGIIYRESGAYFRLVCIGRMAATRQPKLLVIEYNQHDINVREIQCYGLQGNNYLEGTAAFSSPVLEWDHNQLLAGERTFLAVLMSDGTLTCLGDDEIDMASVVVQQECPEVQLLSLSSLNAPIQTDFPLTLFERLSNVSEDIGIHCEGLDNSLDDLKKRLSRDESSSLAIPRGCCISLSLPPGNSSQVMAAIRVCLGGDWANNLVSCFYVCGRKIPVRPLRKRWYNIPLTEEEVAVSVRTRFVSVRFPATQHFRIDALEVYAHGINSYIIPTSYFAETDSSSAVTVGCLSPLDSVMHSNDPLALSISASTNFFELFGAHPPVVSNYCKGILWQIVEGTAVHPDLEMRQNLWKLLETVEPDANKRDREYDSISLRKCHKVLEECSRITSSAIQNNTTPLAQRSWTSVRLILADCLETIKRIANDRPIHYLQNLGDLGSSRSLASKASKAVLAGTRQSSGFEDLTAGVVEIELIEMAMEVFSDDEFSKQRAVSTSAESISPHLYSIGEYILSSNNDVVVACCDTISRFFKDCHNLFVALKEARLVAYQCDCCGVCPIKEVRFTQDEQDGVIDLCRECYTKGKLFMDKKKKAVANSAEVVVDGKPISGLLCVEFNQLRPVSTEKFEVASTRAFAQESEGSDLQRALQFSVQETTNGFEVLLSRSFNFLLPLLIKTEFSMPLIRLLIDLIGNSKSGSDMERANMFVKEISLGLFSLLEIGNQSQKNQSKHTAPSLAVAVRAFIDLLSPYWDHQQPRKPRAKFCSVHGVPTVKRKCAKGPNRDRRFWVCGMEREKRCEYFEWANEAETCCDISRQRSERSPCHSLSTEPRSERMETLKSLVQASLFTWSPKNGSLHEKLCQVLEDEYICNTDVNGGGSERKKKQNESKKSNIRPRDTERDRRDGVLCSKEKLTDVLGDKSSVLRGRSGASEHFTGLLQAICDLLKIISDHKTEGVARWISLLCHLDMSHGSPSVRSLAIDTLKSLCGGDDHTCRLIRERHSFQFYLRQFFHLSSEVIDVALLVKEKARMSGPKWNNAVVHLSMLKAASLAGTNLLIPEDTPSEGNLRKIGKVLDILDKLVKDGGRDSWKKFCGTLSLPSLFGKGTPNDDHCQTVLQLSNTPPIVTLLWFACAVPSSSHQAKALRLVEASLSNDSSGFNAVTAEEILVSSECALGKDDLLSLSMCFVHNGAVTDLRKVGKQVVMKLFSLLSLAERFAMYNDLVVFALSDIGVYGQKGTVTLSLLQEMTPFLEGCKSIGVTAQLVKEACQQQLEAIKHNRSNGFWTALDNMKLVDLSNCCFCSQHISYQSKNHFKVKKAGESGGLSGASGRSAPTRQKWHRDQVSPFICQRLDADVEKTSNEFNLYLKLKHRLAISEVHMNISDPRGRYAKVVQIYFTPRPIGKISILKSDEYSSRWQKLGTLRMARGATRASITLSAAIVAANIRLHFEEFYARPGEGSRGSDGSLVALCPRCTNPVTNLAGVCGRCGESIALCRKCRRINYDVMDGYFCGGPDCTFSPHGQISLEVNAGIATNAIAITNDKDSARAQKMLGLAQSLEEDLRESLREKVVSLATTNDSEGSIFGPVMQRAFLGLPPSLTDDREGINRPCSLTWLDKQGSVVQAVADQDSSHVDRSRSLSSTDRTRSLLNIARQIRNDSGSSQGINLDNLEVLLGSDSGGLETAQSRERPNNPMQPTDTNDEANQDESRKSDTQTIHRLIMLTREAERERFALQHRLKSWEALNNGVLVNTTPNIAVESVSFSPSHCSFCSSIVAYHLLKLWVCMLDSFPHEVQVDESILKWVLFEDMSFRNHVAIECKMHAVISIATKSHTGAEMVLSAMRKRLSATEDKFCTQVLGKILEADDFAHPTIATEYTELAMDVLSSRSLGNL